jgi:hypothetical protein
VLKGAKMAAEKTFSWTCPFCNQTATITRHSTSSGSHQFNEDNKEGDLIILTDVTVCPNPACREYRINASLHRAKYNGSSWTYSRAPIQSWQLRPRSSAKPLPAYISKAIVDDYEEACLIVSDSPKASATLSRRCLQGMIRDFWKISRARLIDEIKELEGRIDATTWQAIDGVRKVGNIGAHMEKDIDLIVDVDPEEAQILIGLIEFLIDDWYVARYDREEHMKRVIDLAKHKDDLKAGPTINPQAPGEEV